ncbi:MAG: hypothetical protein AAF957_22905 [Planctomycetota bacterium]
MIRDLTFDELERSAHRRRLVRLVLGVTTLSTILTAGVVREVRIYDAVSDVPSARPGDLDSLRNRRAAIEGLLDKHHFWTGAFQARGELDDLVLAIHSEERALEKLAVERRREVQRIREEAEAARNRGLVYAERKDYALALLQFKRALELADAIGAEGFGGQPWEHRSQIEADVRALQAVEGGR